MIWSDTIIESDVQVCPTELVDDKIQSVMENHFGQTSSKIQPRIFYVSVKKNLNKILIWKVCRKNAISLMILNGVFVTKAGWATVCVVC